MDCSLPVFSVHGILQARILEWIAMPSSRGSSWRRDWTQVSCTAGRFFAVWATRKPILILKGSLKAAFGLRKNTHKVMWLEKGLLFSHSVMSDSLWPHGLRHARLPRLSPSPEVCSNTWSLSRWCHPTISSSVAPFSSCLQSFPASGSFSMSRLFTSDGQSIGASASASVLPMNYSGLSPQSWSEFSLEKVLLWPTDRWKRSLGSCARNWFIDARQVGNNALGYKWAGDGGGYAEQEYCCCEHKVFRAWWPH